LRSRSSLLKFIAKRILLSIPVLFGVVFLTFVISRIVVPDPIRAWVGVKASQSYADALILRYHLNAPLWVQFYYYVEGYLTGNWGVSPISQLPVLQEIEARLPATIELTLVAMLFIIFFGITLGVIAAIKKDKWPDQVSRITALAGVSSPPFLGAIIILLIFFFYLHWFPNGSRLDPGLSPPGGISFTLFGDHVKLPPTGLYILDSLLTGNWVDLFSSIRHIILPAFALAVTYFGITTRLVRSSMLNVLNEDYVRTAKAKGLGGSVVIFKHTLRNALMPATTIISLNFATLLGGTVVIEDIFNWPGIGRFTVQALENLDYPTIIGTTLVFAIGVVAVNLIADILYAVLDPRVQPE
jgi:ABC-type dipeptide/oligopeptide/nickel transport system permease component